MMDMFGRIDLSRAQIPCPQDGGTVFKIAMGGARDHGGNMRPLNYTCQAGVLHFDNYLPRNFSSISEDANPSEGAPTEACQARSASRVMPPNWPSGVPL